MGFNIEDGTGRGTAAGVDTTNRLLVRNVGETIFQNAAEEGEAFFAGTPIIEYTTATEIAVLHLVNNGNDPLVLGNFLLMAETANATGPTRITPAFYTISWYRNAGGMTNSTAFTPLNQNWGSSAVLEGNFSYGDGATSVISGSPTPVATLSFPTEVLHNFEANLVLEKGSELCITITPPATNISMRFWFGTRLIRYIERY